MNHHARPRSHHHPTILLTQTSSYLWKKYVFFLHSLVFHLCKKRAPELGEVVIDGVFLLMYKHDQVVFLLLLRLCRAQAPSNAPKFVLVTRWKKTGFQRDVNCSNSPKQQYYKIVLRYTTTIGLVGVNSVVERVGIRDCSHSNPRRCSSRSCTGS